MIDEQLLARAVAINDALAGEFVDQQPALAGRALSRLAPLGIRQRALMRTRDCARPAQAGGHALLPQPDSGAENRGVRVRGGSCRTCP